MNKLGDLVTSVAECKNVQNDHTAPAKRKNQCTPPQMHGDMEKVHFLISPYCPETFRNLGPHNKQIYISRVRPKINEILETKTWAMVWEDIYQRNNKYHEEGREYADQYISPNKNYN